MKIMSGTALGAAVLPLASGAATPKAAKAAAPPQSGTPIAARPDHILDVVEKEVDFFGTPIRGLLSGGSWPGKEIRYKKGDIFRVQVANHLAEPTSLHWHGLILPNLQDGVPGVTQAPLEPGALMYYEFPLVQAGTYWYHSHFGLQEQEGLAGPLIIDDPDEMRAYDHDVTLFLSDVLTGSPVDMMKGLQSGSVEMNVSKPYLLPGETKFNIDVPYAGYLLNGRSNDDPWSYPAAVGDRLRLRVINASTSSNFRLMIDGLPLTVIASDGEDLEPVEVDNLMLSTAERYDLLVTIPEAGNFTVHAAALGDDKQVVGVIHTKDRKPEANRARAVFTNKILTLAQMKASQNSTLPKGPSRVLETKLSGNMEKYFWLINDVAYPEPYAPEGAQNIPFEVGYGEVVRIDIINPTPMVHPMHLHGHVFRVLGAGARSPRKDTVAVMPKSKLSIEFYANNPGKWFWHCHNLYHLASGMARELHYVV
jgi:FtsP/CotA-like multicopper oxidase with cupredoxin domain